MTQLIHWEPWEIAIQVAVITLVAGPIIAWKITRAVNYFRNK
jgi:hypothetical protein